MRIVAICYEPHTLPLRPSKFFFQQLHWFLWRRSCFIKWYEKERSIKLRPLGIGIYFMWVVAKCLHYVMYPRAHDPSGLWQGSRAMAWSNTGSPWFTSRQIWQIWLVENTIPTLCAYSENWVQSSRSMPKARRIVGSGDENDVFHEIKQKTWTNFREYAVRTGNHV